MKYKVELESDRGMKEKNVRESIDRAANMARIISQQRGESDKGHDAYRKQMIEHAEKDKRKGRL